MKEFVHGGLVIQRVEQIGETSFIPRWLAFSKLASSFSLLAKYYLCPRLTKAINLSHMPSSVLGGSGILLLWIKLKGHKICQLPTLQPLKDFEMRTSLLRPARLSTGPAQNNSPVDNGVAFLSMVILKDTESALWETRMSERLKAREREWSTKHRVTDAATGRPGRGSQLCCLWETNLEQGSEVLASLKSPGASLSVPTADHGHGALIS